jgi:hypothetical protein
MFTFAELSAGREAGSYPDVESGEAIWTLEPGLE